MDSISKISVNGVTYAIEGTTYQFELDGNSLKMGVNEGTKTAIYTPSVPSWLTGTLITGTGSNITAYIMGAKVGDMYLNTSTENIYQCTSSNKWAYKCNIKGTNGTNATTTSVFSSTANGLAPSTASANQAVAETTSSVKYLCSDKKWRPLPANAFLAGQTYSVMGASGTNHASGLVPDPGATAGTSKYLREDGTWAEPEANVEGLTETIEFIPACIGVPDLSGLSQVSANEHNLAYNMTDNKFYESDGSSWQENNSITWDEFYVLMIGGGSIYYVETGEQPVQLSERPSGYVCYWSNTNAGTLLSGVVSIAQLDSSDINGTTYTIDKLQQIESKISYLPSGVGLTGQILKVSSEGNLYWDYPQHKTVDTRTNVSGSLAISTNYDITVATLSGDISGITHLGTFFDGLTNTIILYNQTAQERTVVIANTSSDICPGGQNLSLSIPSGGYGEVNLLHVNNKTYVRAV